jgi:hypothetical protein
MVNIKILEPLFQRVTCRSPFTADSESKLRDQIRKADVDTNSREYKVLSPEGKNNAFCYHY